MGSFNDLLFSEYEILGLPQVTEQKMIEAIDTIDGNKLLNTSVDDWCDYLEQEYVIHVPVIKDSEITVDQNEAKIDVSHDPRRFIPSGQSFYVTGTKIIYHVPFDGDEDMFRFRPSTYNFNPPRAIVANGELRLTFASEKINPDQLKSQFNKRLNEIKNSLECLRNDVEKHNGSVRSKARTRIEARRQKLLDDQGLVASLGYSIRPRDNQTATYVSPVTRKKPNVQMPSGGTDPFKPEPVLEMQEYEKILSVMSNMVDVMERSPSAFRGMKEEDIRQHFLVQLNGQYEGQATGETFNFEGKTDILIRDKGKNIFIAECKFWRGAKSFADTIDQLLGYTCWRDTKTAILVFNREKNFSNVLSQIPDLVKQHSNFKRELSHAPETGFRFVLNHRDDKDRDIILTVLAFEVPK